MVMLACGIVAMIMGVALGGMALEMTLRTIKHYLDVRSATDAIAFHREMQRRG